MLEGGDWFPRQTYGALTVEAARRWPERVALEFEGESWTFAALEAEVCRVARALVRHGVTEGSHVGLWINNRPEFILLFFATVRIGAVAVPMNTRWRQDDLLSAIEVADIDFLFCEKVSGPIDYERLVDEVIVDLEASPNDCRKVRRGNVIVLGAPEAPGFVAWDGFLAGADAVDQAEVDARAARVDPDGLCVIIYTSGSTGRPKGVMLSHRGIRSATDRATMLGMTRNDVQLNYIPLFHNYSLAWVTIQNLITGARQVLMSRFDAAEALRLISERGVTMIHGFEAHYFALMDAYDATPERYDLRTLRVGSHAVGSESGTRLIRRVQQVFCRTVSAYGMSETWSAVTCDHPRDLTEEVTCTANGYPLPGVEFRIIEPVTGAALPEGQIGEICVRSTSLMLGYYRNEAETRKAVDPEGWLHSGDTGYIRPDGRLAYVGRFKDMIRVGGENVDPREIETMLMRVEGIEQVVTVSAPDPVLTEVVAAAIVLSKGFSAEQVELAVKAACTGRIASFKAPRHLKFLASVPLTGSEKVDRAAVRALFWEA